MDPYKGFDVSENLKRWLDRLVRKVNTDAGTLEDHAPRHAEGGADEITITEAQISDLDHYDSTDFNTDFSGKSTTDLSEGANLYYTDERVDDRVSALIQDGTGLSWTYDDGANTLTGDVSVSPFLSSAQTVTGVWDFTGGLEKDGSTVPKTFAASFGFPPISSGGSATLTQSPGLGTDNVMISVMAEGQSDADEWVAVAVRPDGQHSYFRGGAGSVDLTPPSAPSSGDIIIKMHNTHTSSQGIDVSVLVTALD